MRAPLKKLASETTYFELNVGAGVSSFWAAEFSKGLLKAYLFIGGQNKLNTVSQVTETPKMTQSWEAVQFESDISLKWLWIKTSSCCRLKPIFTRNPLKFVSDFYLQDRSFPRSANDFIAATISQLHTHFAADDICEIQPRPLYSI